MCLPFSLSDFSFHSLPPSFFPFIHQGCVRVRLQMKECRVGFSSQTKSTYVSPSASKYWRHIFLCGFLTFKQCFKQFTSPSWWNSENDWITVRGSCNIEPIPMCVCVCVHACKTTRISPLPLNHDCAFLFLPASGCLCQLSEHWCIRCIFLPTHTTYKLLAKAKL